MAKEIKKITAEEKAKQNKAVLRKLRKIKNTHILDDSFRQMPKFTD